MNSVVRSRLASRRERPRPVRRGRRTHGGRRAEVRTGGRGRSVGSSSGRHARQPVRASTPDRSRGPAPLRRPPRRAARRRSPRTAPAAAAGPPVSPRGGRLVQRATARAPARPWTSRRRRCGAWRAAARARRSARRSSAARSSGPSAQVERAGRVLAPGAGQLRAARGRRVPGQVQVAHRHRPGGVHPLDAAGRPRTRRWCAAPRGGPPAPRSARVSGPGSSAPRQPQRQRRCCSGAAGLELVEEPQPLLGEGQRQRRRRRGAGATGGTRRAAAVAQAPRRARPRWGPRTASAAAAPRPAPARTRRDQLGGEQRVPAELEEVVVDADPVDAQHLGRTGRHSCLLARRREASRRRGAPRSGRGGQRRAVDLAVGGQRQRVQGDEGGRHHVVGQRGRRGAPAARRRPWSGSAAGTT